LNGFACGVRWPFSIAVVLQPTVTEVCLLLSELEFKELNNSRMHVGRMLFQAPVPFLSSGKVQEAVPPAFFSRSINEKAMITILHYRRASAAGSGMFSCFCLNQDYQN